MKNSDFIFDCVEFLHYKCHKTNLNCGGSYIKNYPDSIRNKKQQYVLSRMMINALNTLKD